MDILELRALLARHRLPLERWGRDGTKTIQHLLNEITSGECRLVVINGTLWRCIRPLDFCIDGYDPDTGQHLALFEQSRFFKNGANGTRSLKVSFAEKLNLAKPERLRDGIARAFREELEVELSEEEMRSVIFLAHRIETQESPSFPGLSTRMQLLYFGLTMPPRHFRPEYLEVQPDKTTIFAWKPYAERPWAKTSFIRM